MLARRLSGGAILEVLPLRVPHEIIMIVLIRVSQDAEATTTPTERVRNNPTVWPRSRTGSAGSLLPTAEHETRG
jgi:hypothetical protein